MLELFLAKMRRQKVETLDFSGACPEDRLGKVLTRLIELDKRVDGRGFGKLVHHEFHFSGDDVYPEDVRRIYLLDDLRPIKVAKLLSMLCTDYEFRREMKSFRAAGWKWNYDGQDYFRFDFSSWKIPLFSPQKFRRDMHGGYIYRVDNGGE